MATYKIPLTNIPQAFEISLAGTNYLLTCKFNDADEGGWVIDLADAATSEPIVANLALITGADVLENLDYLGFEGSMIVFTDGNDLAVPTLDNLGTESNLYFVTEDDG